MQHRYLASPPFLSGVTVQAGHHENKYLSACPLFGGLEPGGGESWVLW